MSKGMDQKKNQKKKAAKTPRRKARGEEGQEGRALFPAASLIVLGGGAGPATSG